MSVRVTVWRGTLADLRPWHIDALDAEERARFAGFRLDDDARRFALGATLLRHVVAHELHIDPRDITVDRTCRGCGRPHGRPTVAGVGPRATSVSHAGRHVVVASAASAVGGAPPEVGIDIEVRRPIDPAMLAPYVCHPLESVPADVESFLTVWTRKEAVLKATGEGLRRPMAEIRLHGTTVVGGASVVLVDVPLAPDAVASVAVLGGRAVTCSVRDARELGLTGAAPAR